MNFVRVKENRKVNVKTIERHPVKVLGNDYRVKIIYKNEKYAQVDVEEDTIKITLQSRYKKIDNNQMLDLAIQKMYKAIANVEIERTMEKTRLMMGFAPEDYIISSSINNYAKCENDIIKINPNIVMNNRELIDYIILKQYCHLKFKTQCKSFYNLLSKYCPNYEKYEKLLKI